MGHLVHKITNYRFGITDSTANSITLNLLGNLFATNPCRKLISFAYPSVSIWPLSKLDYTKTRNKGRFLPSKKSSVSTFIVLPMLASLQMSGANLYKIIFEDAGKSSWQSRGFPV